MQNLSSHLLIFIEVVMLFKFLSIDILHISCLEMFYIKFDVFSCFLFAVPSDDPSCWPQAIQLHLSLLRPHPLPFHHPPHPRSPFYPSHQAPLHPCSPSSSPTSPPKALPLSEQGSLCPSPTPSPHSTHQRQSQTGGHER